MFNTSNQTRNKKTESEYLKRASNRLSAYIEQTGNQLDSSDASVNQLSNYLRSQRAKNKYKQNTWRKIRAELKFYFETNEMESYIKMVDELPRLKILDEKEDSKIKALKHLPAKLTQDIFAQLMENKDQENSITIMHWISATRVVGARPCEWISAKLKKDFEMPGKNGATIKKAIIQFDNAKNTNGRTFGEKRQIILNDVNPDEMKDIEYMVQLVETIRNEYEPHQWEQAWEQYYEMCRGLLYRTNKKVRPKGKINLTFYSARHQFAADSKASGITEYERAALMGHGSIATAEKHYGKKHLGDKDKFRVRAPKHLIKKVYDRTSKAAMEKRKKSKVWIDEKQQLRNVMKKISTKMDKS